MFYLIIGLLRSSIILKISQEHSRLKVLYLSHKNKNKPKTERSTLLKKPKPCNSPYLFEKSVIQEFCVHRSFPVPPDSYITKTMSQSAAASLLSGMKKTSLISCLKKTTARNLTITKGAKKEAKYITTAD